MWRFLLSVGVPTLMVAIASIYFDIERRRLAYEKDAVAHAESVAAMFAREVEVWKTAIASVIASVDTEQDSLDIPGLARIAGNVAERFGGWAVLTTNEDPTLMLFNTLQPDQINIRIDQAVPEIVALMRATDVGASAQLSDVFQGPIADQIVFAMVAKFSGPKGQQYVLSFAFNDELLDALILGNSDVLESEISLMDGTNRFVSRSNGANTQRLIPVPASVAVKLQQRSSGFHVVTTDDTTDLGVTAYAAVRGTNWSVIIHDPPDSTQRTFIEMLSAYGAGTISLLFFGGLYRTREIIKERHEAQRRLVEQQKTFKLLSTTLEKMRKAEKDRRETIGVLGHEIRTPVLGALGSLDMLLAQASDDNKAALIGSARHGLDCLLSLTDDMLDMARLDAQVFKIANIGFDLVAFVKGATDVIMPLAQRKGLAVSLKTSERMLWVIGDPHRLRQVLLNLLTNAVRYTPSGKVTLELLMSPCGDDQCKVVLSVADTGPGIAPDALEKIFQPFERGTIGQTSIGGLGLGLAVSRRIVKKMGGILSVEPREGGGSVFLVSLTLDRAVNPSSDAVPEPAEAANWLRGLSILLVEDDPLQASIILRFLKAQGVDTAHATTGRQALALVTDLPPDIIVIDLDLPDMTGVELARRLQASGNAVRRIAFSANPACLKEPSETELFHAKSRKSGEIDSFLNAIQEAFASV